eukprot:jgi/Botrbrau1/17603/Bobra.0166s0040.1
MSLSQLKASGYLRTIFPHHYSFHCTESKPKLGELSIWEWEDGSGIASSRSISPLLGSNNREGYDLCSIIPLAGDHLEKANKTPSSQVVRGPPTPRLGGCGRDLSEGLETLPERLMKKVGLSGHDYTGDTTAPYDPAQHLRTQAILGHPSLPDAQSADAAGRMGGRGSPPQAQSKDTLDIAHHLSRGSQRHLEEAGPGSGGWDDHDDEDSSGPSRPISSSMKRAGGTGMTQEELATMDPKRVRRIIANRQSAARSKERRLKYTRDLEQKVSQLQDEISHLRHRLDTETERNKRSEADLQQQLNARHYAYEGSGRYHQDFRQSSYNQGPSASVGVPQHPSRPMDLLQLSHLHNPSLSQHVQMGGQQHQAHEAFAASAARPYGYGGMGISSGVAGSGLIASAQGQDESAGRPRGSSTSGAWMGVNMLGTGPDTVRGHHGEGPMEVSSMHPHSATSPSSPGTAQDPYLESAANGMDSLVLTHKMFPGYSPDVPVLPTSLSMLGTPQMLSPLEEMPQMGSNPLSLLRILKDCHSQQQGGCNMLEPLPQLHVNPVIKQEAPQMGPSEGQMPDSHLAHPGSMQHSWGQPSLLSGLDQHLQMRGGNQPSSLWCTRPAVTGSQWNMDGSMRGPQAGGPPTCHGMSMVSRDRSRDLGMPMPSAPASLTIQITLPRGREGPVSQTGSPATRPSTPSGAWRVDHSGRAAVLRTESLPVDFRVGSKFEGATN